MNSRDILKQIMSITTHLIENGLSNSQRYPREKRQGEHCDISYDGFADLSIALKNVPYTDIYTQLKEQMNYNVELIDGGLIQMLYRFQNEGITSHRLAFWPSPFLENYQNEPEFYDEDEIYADILQVSILPTAVRFDYDPSNWVEEEHPRTHLTLGQYKNCRIPVEAPLTPLEFITFILRNFYNTAFCKYGADLSLNTSSRFKPTISSAERRLLHIASHL